MSRVNVCWAAGKLLILLTSCYAKLVKYTLHLRKIFLKSFFLKNLVAYYFVVISSKIIKQKQSIAKTLFPPSGMKLRYSLVVLSPVDLIRIAFIWNSTI